MSSNIEERLDKALWALSGTDDLVPKVEKALRVAIEMSYKSGLAFNRGILLGSGDDCVETFIRELEDGTIHPEDVSEGPWEIFKSEEGWNVTVPGDFHSWTEKEAIAVRDLLNRLNGDKK